VPAVHQKSPFPETRDSDRRQTRRRAIPNWLMPPRCLRSIQPTPPTSIRHSVATSGVHTFPWLHEVWLPRSGPKESILRERHPCPQSRFECDHDLANRAGQDV